MSRELVSVQESWPLSTVHVTAKKNEPSACEPKITSFVYPVLEIVANKPSVIRFPAASRENGCRFKSWPSARSLVLVLRAKYPPSVEVSPERVAARTANDGQLPTLVGTVLGSSGVVAVGVAMHEQAEDILDVRLEH